MRLCLVLLLIWVNATVGIAQETAVVWSSPSDGGTPRDLKRIQANGHPMTNVDGVAQGFEYRGGYDFPEARGSATARMTFETIDRLKPEYAVAWHNWIAPRDRNVVFFTDGNEIGPTARAWQRFTQLFPSLRDAGHRWKDEATPLKYNWYDRQPLSESNPHQYAMKRYGTRVWGWEMPWWNFQTQDARRLGAAFARAFIQTLDEIRADKIPAASELPSAVVPMWEMHELTVRGQCAAANPFVDAAVVGQFVSPSGKLFVQDGFYDGDDVWRLRFSPNEVGKWTYQIRGEAVSIHCKGQIECSPAVSRGFVGVHPENPYALAFSNGSAYFPMGDTCYGLFDDSPITEELRTLYLNTRRSQRFNFVRMSVGHSAARAAADPDRYWAWGGTPASPDLDRFNPLFFRGFDELLRQMHRHEMNAEILVFNYYRQPFTNPEVWTAARERRWIRYLMARYSAFSNIMMWTISNEYETHPDGKYRLDLPQDVDWAKSMAKLIKENDSYRHLVTVHPVVSASTTSTTPRSPFVPPWRIGEFFGDGDAMDVLSQQTGQSGEGTTWNETLGCWQGDDSNLVASIRADHRYGKPVLNTENGYEYLRGHPTEKKQVHHTDKVRRSSWRIVCAGGYIAAGFHGTIGHSDAWNRLDAPNHYTFAVADEGAAGQLGLLYDFFSTRPYWRLTPFEGVSSNAVALGDAANEYIIYIPHGGSTRIDLSGAAGRFSATWINPREGGKNARPDILAGTQITIEPPTDLDWVLHLVKTVAPPGN